MRRYLRRSHTRLSEELSQGPASRYLGLPVWVSVRTLGDVGPVDDVRLLRDAARRRQGPVVTVHCPRRRPFFRPR